MKRYLIILNTILFLFACSVSLLFFPIGKSFYACGAILGVIMTGGVLTVDFWLTKEGYHDREWFINRIFSKSYLREFVLNAVLATAVYIFSFFIWHPLFIFLLGYMSTVLVFILTEWVYKILVIEKSMDKDGR